MGETAERLTDLLETREVGYRSFSFRELAAEIQCSAAKSSGADACI
jgi:hypothetical protein